MESNLAVGLTSVVVYLTRRVETPEMLIPQNDEQALEWLWEVLGRATAEERQAVIAAANRVADELLVRGGALESSDLVQRYRRVVTKLRGLP